MPARTGFLLHLLTAGFDAVDGSSARHVSAMDVGATKGSHNSEELPMQTVTTIGLDIAKSVFQVHGVDAAGQVVIRRQLKRDMCWRFSRNCRSVSSASKRAPHPIIGRASSRQSATACD